MYIFDNMTVWIFMSSIVRENGIYANRHQLWIQVYLKHLLCNHMHIKIFFIRAHLLGIRQGKDYDCCQIQGITDNIKYHVMRGQISVNTINPVSIRLRNFIDDEGGIRTHSTLRQGHVNEDTSHILLYYSSPQLTTTSIKICIIPRLEIFTRLKKTHDKQIIFTVIWFG